MAKSSWLTVSPMSGSGNATLTNTGANHTGRNSRSTSVTATVKGLSVSRSYTVVQKALAEFVSITGSASITVDKEGQTLTLSGISNSSKLTFASGSTSVAVPTSYTVNEEAVTNGMAISGDPGASAQYAFSISVTIPVNTTASTRSFTITVTTASGAKATWTLNQAASSITYTLTLSPSVSTIAAKGGSSTISGTLRTYRNGTLISTDSVSPTCTVSGSVFSVSSGNVVSVGSRGTTVGDARSTIVTGSYNGTIATVIVSQEANKVESSVNSGGGVTYGNVTIGTITNATIAASGGTGTATAGKGSQSKTVAATYRTDTYTSEATNRVQTASAVTTTESIDPSVSSISGTASSKGTTISAITTVKSQDVTWTGNGSKSVSGTMYVYQEANAVESSSRSGGVTTWGSVTAGTISSKTIPASGGTATATAGNGSQSWTKTAVYRTDTYTSGSKSDPVLETEADSGSVVISPSVSSISGTASSKGTTISAITTVKSQDVTWTGNGSKSVSGTMYVYQEANARSLEKYSNSVSYSDIGADGSAAVPTIIDYPCYWSYTSGDSIDLARSSLTISYSKNWGGGSSYNNASIDTSNGYVTADSLGTTAKSRKNVLDSRITFAINSLSVSEIVYVYQAANAKTSVEYGTPSVSLTIEDIPASGGTISSGSVTYSQSQNQYYTSGAYEALSTVTSGGTVSYGSSVSANSLGTTVKSRTKVGTLTVTVTLNGKSGSGSADVYQEANAATSIIYGTPSVSLSVSDIPASGGRVSSGTVTYSQSRTQNYTSGSTSALSALTSGGSVLYGTAVDASSLGTTVKNRASVGTLSVTVTMNGKSGSDSVTVYQQANSAIYGAVSVTATTPVSIPASGGSSTISPTASQTVSYTSGSTRAGSVSLSYAVKTSKTGFSLSGATVTATQNTSTSDRNGFVVTVTATGEGSRSATIDVTFNQAGASATLSVSPTSLSFVADGEGKTISIISNGDWTIS